MFDVGFAEIFLLGLIGLLVLGPERLPAVARTVGGFMRKARASWASLRSTIEAELAEADIAAPIKEAGEELKRIGKDMKSDLPDMNKIIDDKPTSAKAKATDKAAIDNKTDSAVTDSDNDVSDSDKAADKIDSAVADSDSVAATDDVATEDAVNHDNTVQPGHGSK